jgi:uroporphyrinogen decarboxylase
VGDKVCLQGNMDPTLLNASPERIRSEVDQILGSFGEGTGHVFNLGHGVTPGIDPEHVAAMVDAVVELSPAYH